MQKLCCVAVSAAALLWVSITPSSANPIISFVAEGSAVMNGSQETPTLIGGTAASSGALTYGTDWVEFVISGAAGATATVDELANGFVGETFEIATSAGGAPLGGLPLPADNDPVFFTLSTGVDYFLGLSAPKPLSGFGRSDYSVSVTGGVDTPIPGTLALFAGGLGLLAFAGLRRGRKSARFSGSFAGA